MQRINLIFDEIYDDVDILLVPDDVAGDIENIMFEFSQWLSYSENGDRFRTLHTPQGEFLEIDTEEFLWWLNHIKITQGRKATILEQHTEYDPKLPKAEL